MPTKSPGPTSPRPIISFNSEVVTGPLCCPLREKNHLVSFAMVFPRSQGAFVQTSYGQIGTPFQPTVLRKPAHEIRRSAPPAGGPLAKIINAPNSMIVPSPADAYETNTIFNPVAHFRMRRLIHHANKCAFRIKLPGRFQALRCRRFPRQITRRQNSASHRNQMCRKNRLATPAPEKPINVASISGTCGCFSSPYAETPHSTPRTQTWHPPLRPAPLYAGLGINDDLPLSVTSPAETSGANCRQRRRWITPGLATRVADRIFWGQTSASPYTQPATYR